MSFTEKELQFVFSGAASGELSASGLRAAVSIQEAQGPLGVSAQVRIWGLTMSQMSTYSTPLAAGVGVNKFNLVINAGDLGGQPTKIIDAPIWASWVDLSGAPDSMFYVSVAGIYLAATSIGSMSIPPMTPGTPSVQKAEVLIQSLCATSGLTLNNPSGATGELRNPSTYGSVITQIHKIASAANLNWKIVGTHVWIWSPSDSIDGVTIDMGPDTGMVGYPQFWEQGMIVTSEFNQRIQVGRLMNVTSSIPNANGPWRIVNVQHDLTTMLQKGPWFTTAVLAPFGSTTAT